MNRILIIMLGAFVASCADPYRVRDVQITETAIVVDAVLMSASYQLEEDEWFYKEVNTKRSHLLVRPGEWTGQVGRHIWLSEAPDVSRVILRTISGEYILLYYPDSVIRAGDCIDFLTVDGKPTASYSSECPSELITHNKSPQPTADGGG